MRNGLKVRFHDLAEMVEWGASCYEFHFTDKDLDASLGDAYYDCDYAVHCPEYWEGVLLDPCSTDESKRMHTVDIIQRTIDKAREMVDNFRTESPKIILHPGGMSLEPLDPSERPRLLANLADSVGRLDTDGVRLLLENMPPFPWYYGGQWVHNVFMDADEIREFLAQVGRELCFDLSHAQLWCAHSGADLDEYIEKVKPLIRHVHVADATGVDGEGVQIDEGDIDFAAAMAHFAGLDVDMIPEIWYGHKNNGEGFRIAFERLAKYYPAGSRDTDEMDT